MNPLEPIPLAIPFKGKRHYLHGSDIVPALFALTGPVERPCFQFHRMATRSLCARWVDERELARLRREGELVVLMSSASPGPAGAAPRLLAVVESGLPPTEARVPFDEDALLVGARSEGSEIRLMEPGSASFIERVIVLNKALLNRLVAPQAWVFARLDLQRGPVDAGELCVSFVRAMGTQVFKSDIRGDGRALGSIYFSRSAA